MDYLEIIKAPIIEELDDFIALFNRSLTHGDGLLEQALSRIRSHGGKRMRPMLMLLIAKNYGQVTDMTLSGAVGLELLHTASLVHDDIVDESAERRGQASMNASYDNKVAVLVGDYILSTSLLYISHTHNEHIVRELAELGRTLSDGEILEISNTADEGLSEEIYFQVIERKTAALFEECCVIGAVSAAVSGTKLQEVREFGRNLGVIFQIRDDIFDYFDAPQLGKPTGSDMAEGKLTLPIIHALNTYPNDEMRKLARKVKESRVSPDEIALLVDYAKQNGGIEYAEKMMNEYREKCLAFIENHIKTCEIKRSLLAYVDFIIQRTN